MDYFGELSSRKDERRVDCFAVSTKTLGGILLEVASLPRKDGKMQWNRIKIIFAKITCILRRDSSLKNPYRLKSQGKSLKIHQGVIVAFA